jgi:hypothetical protein
MKIKFKKNMSFGFGWALPTLPPLTSRHCTPGLLTLGGGARGGIFHYRGG